MTRKAKISDQPKVSSTLMPIAVDVDLVRFEKNLLQIGFFGANDARDKNKTSRRIEQVVFRNGHKIKVAAEFRGSELLGLPSTTDRDKFIALLKIMSEERVRSGVISNPIRFSGYRLIQELGLSRNGEIYEEILRWGKRMSDTTITSEQVVYRAAKKVYSDEVLHVFRSFRRTGSSNLNGTERQEHYEVVLEDWLIENLNQRYVIPEDFNAYKQLTRPTAKGIFGNLHLWFHASQGRQVEKDYAELCNLLNVQTYPHLSKIRSTMGLALDELVSIRYLSRWDVQKMSSKEGYKVVLGAGEELMKLLENTRPEKRELGPVIDSSSVPVAQPALNDEQERALELLRRHGVLASKAERLVRLYEAELIVDTVEYLTDQITSGMRRSVENPAGLIIYSLENGASIPKEFVSRRKQKAIDEAVRESRQRQDEEFQSQIAYARWVDKQLEEAVRTRFTEDELKVKIAQMVTTLSKTDEQIRRMPLRGRQEIAERAIRQDVGAELELPSLEEWKLHSEQISLF